MLSEAGRIAGVASALPKYRYDQRTITAALKHHWRDRMERPALLDRLHQNARVDHRHLAYPLERYERFETFGETNAAWIEAAQELGQKALDGALEGAGLERHDLDALIVVSVTGIASPSLDARLINRMGLREDIKRTPIFGVGCVGGALGLTRAADHTRAYPDQTAALLAVELCSLTMQGNDVSMANLISTGLFADGAVAAIVSGPRRDPQGPRILATQSFFYPGTEGIMGWNISERGFEIVLSPRLPDLIRCRLARDVDCFLANHKLKRADIQSWVIHTGGPKVLDAIADALSLRHGELDSSWKSLARYGNLSSASVLLVLEDLLTSHHPTDGTLGLMLAMGPGFCSEMLLVQW
jgi:alkylresorcinol/alkylpyrone synthase